jgi:hypothetical protein
MIIEKRKMPEDHVAAYKELTELLAESIHDAVGSALLNYIVSHSKNETPIKLQTDAVVSAVLSVLISEALDAIKVKIAESGLTEQEEIEGAALDVLSQYVGLLGSGELKPLHTASVVH